MVLLHMCKKRHGVAQRPLYPSTPVAMATTYLMRIGADFAVDELIIATRLPSEPESRRNAREGRAGKRWA